MFKILLLVEGEKTYKETGVPTKEWIMKQDTYALHKNR
ncbi:hypothetical protein CEXT_247931, partial [Caerostris extrusa]